MTTPLLYIGGSSRSGSTLLERMLSCVPGFWPVGELVFIWERGLRRNDLCSCGERFLSCGFWSEVGQRGYGGWDQVDVDEAIALRAQVDRHRNLDRLFEFRSLGPLESAVDAYSLLTARLYGAIIEASGARMIVDSSKHVGYVLMLDRMAGVDLRLIHLVRRSHGVAHSWSRRVLKPGVGDGSTHMSRRSPTWAAGMWLADNLLYDAVRHRVTSSTVVRYEDLIARQDQELSRLLAELCPELETGHARTPAGTALAEPPVSHALSGNPMRFRQAAVTVRADEAWREAMSRSHRAIVSTVTWPLLWQYGYLDHAGSRLRKAAAEQVASE